VEVLEVARQGQKLNDELKEQIRAELVMTNNLNQTAKKYNVSISTVSKIRDEQPDEFEALRRDKKQQLIDKMWDTIVEAQELGHNMVIEAKIGKRDIPLAQISTFLGTIYDKRALMIGDSTSNQNITVQLSGEIESWAN
jgi:tRNA isopentenyl-2-thiomethyl-A-37 hydroxylase MiaE